MTRNRHETIIRHGAPRRAFSLIEVVLVAAILTVVYAIAMPRYTSARARYGAERAAQRLVADLEYASALARTSSREVRMRFQKGDKIDESYYWFENVSDPERPNEDYTVVLRRAPYHVVLVEAPGDLVFRIDGSPKDTRTFVIRSGPDTQRVVTVQQDTGEIEVAIPVTARASTSAACPPPAAFRPRGVTLLELLVSLAITTVIVATLASAVVLVSRSLAIDQHGPSEQTVASARLCDHIVAELKLAVQLSTPLAPDTLQFTVPDRDGDGEQDTIIYTWSGAPDHVLWRQILLSNATAPSEPQVFAEDVRQFDVSYLTRTWGPPPPPLYLESEETLLIHHDDEPRDAGDQVLLVTAGEAMSVQESARAGLFNTWGYAVSTISAGASQAEIDDAAATAHVAYVSEDVSSSDLGTKLRYATIGVVNEEVNLVDDFGVAGDFGFPAPSLLLDVDVTTHPVTSVLAGGPNALFDSDQAVTQLTTATDGLAPGLLVLGSWGGVPALATLPQGAELYGSVTATPDAFGYETVFGHVTGYNDHDKDHVATRVVLGEGAKVTGFTAYLDRQSNRDMVFGIYADDAGEPGALLAQTPEATLLEGVGWETIDLETPLNLVPGTYWLAIGMKKEVKYFFEHTGGTSRLSLEDSDVLMPQWINTVESTSRRISIHANYLPIEYAAGRRVELPWGGNAFDISSLTDAGRSLVQRSLQWAADTTPGDAGEAMSVEKFRHVAQYFKPDLPANAIDWSVTRIAVAIRANPDHLSGKVRFQLRYADTEGIPVTEVIQETSEIPAAAWNADAFGWYEVPFTPQAGLNPSFGLCLVMQGKDDAHNAYVLLDRDGTVSDPDAHAIESVDQGASWSTAGTSDDVRYYVYGTYRTTGAPVWP